MVAADGLAVAELVTSSDDHAFPDGNAMTAVSVRLAMSIATLIISDNGTGFNAPC